MKSGPLLWLFLFPTTVTTKESKETQLLAGPNKQVTHSAVYSSWKASSVQERFNQFQSMRVPPGRNILRRARKEEAGYVVSLDWEWVQKIPSYAPSFFEPFGMYCPLTIDQIHQTRKSIPHCCSVVGLILSTKGFLSFLWIALEEIYQS